LSPNAAAAVTPETAKALARVIAATLRRIVIVCILHTSLTARPYGNHLAEFDRALEWAQIGAFEDVHLAGKGRISTVPTRQVAENRLSKP
jgi:hypothetical protein